MYLEASAAAGNFTRAAKSLGINTSTISRRVGRFEDELGLALFERGHGGVRLTSGGKAVLPHIQRALAELDAIRHAGDQNGNGIVGEVRLAVRMPPVGEPLRGLLAGWREKHPEVVLTIAEMNEWEIQRAIAGASHRCRSDDEPYAVARRRDGAALPRADRRGDPVRTSARGAGGARLGALAEGNLPRSGLGQQSIRPGVLRFVHGLRRQIPVPCRQQAERVRAGRAGFGITLATTSQAEVVFPGVVYRPIREDNAWVQVELVWCPEAEDPAVGRFVAFMRDEARSRRLF